MHLVIRGRFVGMYGARTNLSTAERKGWGEFLANRGIYWDVKLSRKYDWEGWEFFREDGVLKGRPKGLDDYAKANQYYVPRDLAMKMLVLGELA